MISLIKNGKLFSRAFLKFAVIIIFVYNPLGAIKWVFSTYYGSGVTDAHYDILSKNDGNGGVTIQVTTVGSGDGTTSLAGLNSYYLVQMKVGSGGNKNLIQRVKLFHHHFRLS
jgi:hypothetical protein